MLSNKHIKLHSERIKARRRGRQRFSRSPAYYNQPNIPRPDVMASSSMNLSWWMRMFIGFKALGYRFSRYIGSDKKQFSYNLRKVKKI